MFKYNYAKLEDEVNIDINVDTSGETEEAISKIVEEKVQEAVELDESSNEVKEEIATVTELTEDANSLQFIINNIKEYNGLTKQAYELINRNGNLDGLFRVLGVNVEIPSTESYDEYSDYHTTLLVSLEEAKKGLWEKIKEVFKKLKATILDFIQKIITKFTKKDLEISKLLSQIKSSKNSKIDISDENAVVVDYDYAKNFLNTVKKAGENLLIEFKKLDEKSSGLTWSLPEIKPYKTKGSVTWNKNELIEYGNAILMSTKQFEEICNTLKTAINRSEKIVSEVQTMTHDTAAFTRAANHLEEVNKVANFVRASYSTKLNTMKDTFMYIGNKFISNS